MGHLYHGYVSHNLESSPGPPGPNSPTEWSPPGRLLWKHGGFCVVVGARTGFQPAKKYGFYISRVVKLWIRMNRFKAFKGKSKGNLGFSLQPIPDESLANGIGIICHVCPNKHLWLDIQWMISQCQLLQTCCLPPCLTSWILKPHLSTRHLFWARYNLQICACVFNMHIYIYMLCTYVYMCAVYIYIYIYVLCIYIYICCVYIYILCAVYINIYIYIYICMYNLYYIYMRVLCMLYIYIYTDIYSIYIYISLSIAYNICYEYVLHIQRCEGLRSSAAVWHGISRPAPRWRLRSRRCDNLQHLMAGPRAFRWHGVKWPSEL